MLLPPETVEQHLRQQHQRLPQYYIDGLPISKIVTVDKPQTTNQLFTLHSPCLHYVAPTTHELRQPGKDVSLNTRSDITTWDLHPVDLMDITFATFTRAELPSNARTMHPTPWPYISTPDQKHNCRPIPCTSLADMHAKIRLTHNLVVRIYTLPPAAQGLKPTHYLFLPRALFEERRIVSESKRGDVLLCETPYGTLTTPQCMSWMPNDDSPLYIYRRGPKEQAATTKQIKGHATRAWLNNSGYRTFNIDSTLRTTLAAVDHSHANVGVDTAPDKPTPLFQPFSREIQAIDALASPSNTLLRLQHFAEQATKMLAKHKEAVDQNNQHHEQSLRGTPQYQAVKHMYTDLTTAVPIDAVSRRISSDLVHDAAMLWWSFMYDKPNHKASLGEELAKVYANLARGGAHLEDRSGASPYHALATNGQLRTNIKPSRSTKRGRPAGSVNKSKYQVIDVRPMWHRGFPATQYLRPTEER